jgi:hypothetical protein
LSGYEICQVVDIKIIRFVVEYQVEIWETRRAKNIVTDFPDEAKADGYKNRVITPKELNETSNIQSKTNAASSEVSQG